MSSIATPPRADVKQAGRAASKSEEQLFRYVLAPLASLKLAVTTFGFAIVLILVGTLAQVDRDIWEVMEIYFKPWITKIEPSVFFPRGWAPGLPDEIANRSFAFATLGSSIVIALMTLANAQQIRRAPLIAGIVMVVGVAVTVATLRSGAFLFPGGATIGTVMGLNLLAAHALRFKIRASGTSLWIGLSVTAVGILLSWLVIRSGHNADGFQGEPSFAWTTLWLWVKAGVTLTAIGMIVYAFTAKGETSAALITKRIYGAFGIGMAILSLWLWVSGTSTYMGDSGMRILWQLILALLAGIVLYFGCLPLFGRRAGVVLLHAGVLLLMFGQWFVTSYDVEEQMNMSEGESRNYGQDIRSIELALIHRDSDEFEGKDDVVVIPLTRNGKETRFLEVGEINDDQLPFDIEIVDYKKSSRIVLKKDQDASPADRSRGMQFLASDVRGASGASGSEVDLASGYFRFRSKTGEDLGTFLLSQDQLVMRGGKLIDFSTEAVDVGGTEYDAQLRFVRNYKDYTVKLLDVSKDDYIGTTIPKNYSSRVELVDNERGIDRELTIWMNNPWRYAGETFYQSGWQMDSVGNEYTTLQVVRNQGWMIPYVACMICLVGLTAHFFGILVRFLDRRSRNVSDSEATMASGESETEETKVENKNRRAGWILPVLVVATAAVVCYWVALPPKAEPGGLDLYGFGDLPIVYQGRVKPMDTLARNSLRVIGDTESFVGVLPKDELAENWEQIEADLKARWPELEDEDLSEFRNGDYQGLIALVTEKTGGDEYQITGLVEDLMCKRQPAVRWLLDTITQSENANRHKVVRIYHPEVLDLLGLQRRKGYRYSLEEISPKLADFEEQARKANELAQEDSEALSLFQKKVLELDRKLRHILVLYAAFTPPSLPAMPTRAEFESDREAAESKLMAFRRALEAHNDRLKNMRVPLVIPPADGAEDQTWEAYAAAWPMQFLRTTVLNDKPEPSFQAYNEMLVAYFQGDDDLFNSAVASYAQRLETDPPDDLKSKTAFTAVIDEPFGTFYQFETFFNQSAPFLVCAVFYVIAFALLAIGWLGYQATLNRAAYWLLIFTFVIHTLALVARIYISGRPPVTNLYSSAVFIGWGCVALALVIEALYRNGISSVIASICGFATLLIAHKLAGDGDTFEVLQAVLDTQFWLATHVVTITFGYATTFLAGTLGVLYILRGVFTPSLNKKVGGEIARMIYGTICFAIVFSLIGTILGGLWADDSWGRFWGWDPKENGALIIVIWNALILHARWDGMVKDRGLAVLAVIGNVVTAWSWFGVNELGVGLHSYGFTEGRLAALRDVVLVHLLIIAVGMLPLTLWWSKRRNDTTGTV